jgi:hypothetical protein
MVDMDVAIYDIFDLPPMNEYELYIRNFGSSNTVQVGAFSTTVAYFYEIATQLFIADVLFHQQTSTQWNEDYATTETQCEEWFTDDKWTQAPPDQFLESGSGVQTDESSSKSGKKFKGTVVRGSDGGVSLFSSSVSNLRGGGIGGVGVGGANVDTGRLIKFLRGASQVSLERWIQCTFGLGLG